MSELPVEIVHAMIGKSVECPVDECTGRVRLALASNGPGDLLVWVCDSDAAHEWHEDGSPRWGVEFAVEIEIPDRTNRSEETR